MRDKALSLLSRRDHSRRELEQKLKQRGFAAADITLLLDELVNDNLLDESRYIASFIRVHRNRNEGPLKVCAGLQSRGIKREQIVASSEWQEDLWIDCAIAARIKRFGGSVPENKKEQFQQVRFLQQRGFTSEQIKMAIKKSSESFHPEDSNNEIT